MGGADHRLSEATLRAFDQWFAGQVDSVRRQAAPPPDARRPTTSSDDSDSGSSPAGQRHDPDACWRRSADLDVGASEDGEDRRRRGRPTAIEDRSSPPSSLSPPQAFDAAVYDRPLLLAKTLPVPVLPNRNAVYVADAILPPEAVNGSRGDDRHRNGGVDGKTAADYDSDGRDDDELQVCLLYTSPSPRDRTRSRMPSSA